jgi:hypothetical protein
LIELCRIEGEEEQLRLWKEVKTGGLTVRAARSKKTPKQGSQAAKNALSSTPSLVRSGRRFIAELRNTESKALEIDDGTYNELLELYREIGERVEKLAKKAG